MCTFVPDKPSTNDSMTALSAGTPAPDFELKNQAGEMVRLLDYLGSPIILSFYPADWSPVCKDQMVLYDVLLLFEEYKSPLFGISVDRRWCHHAIQENHSLRFALLSDFEPKGAVVCRCGVFDHQVGECQRTLPADFAGRQYRRALYVIESQGIIRWGYGSPSNINPGVDDILKALESLTVIQEKQDGEK